MMAMMMMMMIWFDLHSALEFTNKEGKIKRRVEDKVPGSRTRGWLVIVNIIFLVFSSTSSTLAPSSKNILTDIRSQDRLWTGVGSSVMANPIAAKVDDPNPIP